MKYIMFFVIFYGFYLHNINSIEKNSSNQHYLPHCVNAFIADFFLNLLLLSNELQILADILIRLQSDNIRQF